MVRLPCLARSATAVQPLCTFDGGTRTTGGVVSAAIISARAIACTAHHKPQFHREVDEPWITGLAIRHIARIVAGEFTNYERTTFKARFEYLGESFQLLDGHETSDSDPFIRRGNVRLL